MAPVRHKPLLVLWIGDFKFFNGFLDGGVFVGSVNNPNERSRRAADAGNPPTVILFRSRFLCHSSRVATIP
jgi:hypothetical protein